MLPTRPYKPGTPAPAHLSPFVDNAEEGYIPDRQREINSLAGIETQGTMLGMNGEDESEDSDGEDSVGNEKERRAAVGRGDLDSSSEEESEASSEEEEEPEKPIRKNTRGATAATKKDTTAKTSKLEKKKVLTRAEQQKANEKIKRDLKSE